MKKIDMTGIVGLTGVATSGKDLLCSMLSERISKCYRVALADKLKEDINPFLIQKFGINIYGCTPQEKELVRPVLVAYGKIKRVKTKGTYWTGLVTDSVKELSKTGLVIVTDVRYCDDSYEDDEYFWLKRLGGRLVHIKKYTQELNGFKRYVEPPNEEERRFDPILSSRADFKVEWPVSNNNMELLNPYVDRLVEAMNER